MGIEVTTVRSRRSLLAASVGAAVASVASALGRPHPAAAASPTTFTSAVEGLPAVTALSTVASGTLAVALVADAASHEGTAIKATASHVSGYTTGIHGIAKGFGGYAVKGYGDNSTGWTRGVGGASAGDTGVGVDGYATHPSGATKGMFGINYSTSGTGVAGYANASTGSTAGVVGQANSAGGTGVLGYSGGSSFAPPAPKAKTGVYGEADQDAAARGVWGRSATGSGVYGQSTSGQGVRGYSATGSAGFFATSDPKKGSALRTAGRLRFDHCVGIATIASGASSTTVTPGIALTSASAVVATLQGSAGAATTTVGRVVVSDAADTFTIHLTAAATVNVKVAWHVFG